MNGSPRVSVLMTVYNGAPYLREAVDSIVAQTFTDWELVVVEHGSTDGSAEILGTYDDPRIRVTHLPANIGRTPALRKAFELAAGRDIAVLDADDVAYPTRLAVECAYLDGHPEVVLVGGWARHVDETGRAVGEWTAPPDPDLLVDQFGWRNPIVHSASMYRAAAAAAVGGYPLECPYAQDLALWLRLLRKGGVGVIAQYLCDRRVSSASVTGTRRFRADVARDTLALLQYARRRLPLGREGRRRNRRRRILTSLKYGVALLEQGRVLGGCAALGRALVGPQISFPFE